MADPFLDDEGSEQDNRPREFYQLDVAGVTYYLTSADHDLAHEGQVYTAEPMMRESQRVVTARDGGGNNVFALTIRVDHPIVRRWFKMGVPPQQATVTGFRKQMRSGLVEQIWRGAIVSVSCETDGVAKLNIASLLGEPIRRRLPTIRASKICNHVLYGQGCNADSESVLFKLTTTALYVNGRVVRYDQGNTSASGWAKFGQLIHVASGESMTVLSHGYIGLPSSVVEVEMQNAIPDLHTGDSIIVRAGCDHTIDQCVARFDNAINFGGMPALPTRNPFFRGYGVMERK